jgi:hypothetical protein
MGKSGKTALVELMRLSYEKWGLEERTPGLLQAEDVGPTGGSVLYDGAYSFMQPRHL